LPFEGESTSSKENNVRLLNYKRKPTSPLFINTSVSSNSTLSNSSARPSRDTGSENCDLKKELKTDKDLKRLRTIRMLSSPSQSIEVDDNLNMESNKNEKKPSINGNRINFSNKYDDADSDSNEENFNKKIFKDDPYYINKLSLFGKSNLKRSKSLDLSNDCEALHTRKNKAYEAQIANKGKR
jgi:hypothetical protein